MAVKEARCPNCGSLINVDVEKVNTCIFCWATVDAAQAMNLVNDATGYEFPNESFDEPDDEAKNVALASYRNGVNHSAKPRKTTSAKPVTKKVKSDKLTPAEQVAKLNQDFVMPIIKLNRKVLIQTVSVFLLIILAVVAWAFPTVTARDVNRVQMKQDILAGGLSIDDVSFFGSKNDRLIAVSSAEWSGDMQQQFLATYAKSYAKAYDLELGAVDVEVILYTPNGSYSLNSLTNDGIDRTNK